MKKTFQKVILLATAIAFGTPGVFAKEGMWMPSQLKRQESDMQKLGLKIPVERSNNCIFPVRIINMPCPLPNAGSTGICQHDSAHTFKVVYKTIPFYCKTNQFRAGCYSKLTVRF